MSKTVQTPQGHIGFSCSGNLTMITVKMGIGGGKVQMVATELSNPEALHWFCGMKGQFLSKQRETPLNLQINIT